MPEPTDKTPARVTRAPPQAWRPRSPFGADIDHLMSVLRRPLFGRGGFDVTPFFSEEALAAPAVNIAETDGAYEITAELPGVDEKDVELNYANGVLTLRGHKSETHEDTSKGYLVTERAFGSFERSFRVPDHTDADHIQAAFAKGVLTITLPKAPEAQGAAKKVPITST